VTELQFRSLDRWPRTPTRERIRARFSDDYGKTLSLLERELRQLKARDVVVLADCAASDLRRDGSLRAGCRLRSPGIVLCFTGKHGPVRMPCDRYDDWRDNLRAIAVSLEALRAVDRHGVTTSGEQYRGWSALPPAIEMPASEFASAEDAAEFLMRTAWGGRDRWQCILADVFVPGNLTLVYRDAAKKAHPDQGGSDELMAKVNRAKEFIALAGGAA
jgi:hypothetical protein